MKDRLPPEPLSPFQSKIRLNKSAIEKTWMPILLMMEQLNVGRFSIERTEWGVDIRMDEYEGGFTCPKPEPATKGL